MCTTFGGQEDDESLSGWSIGDVEAFDGAGIGWDVDGAVDDFLMMYSLTGVSNSEGNATGKPTISGTAAIGQTLTADTSALTDAEGFTRAEAGEEGFAFAWQWVRNDGVNDEDIPGATRNSYHLTADDLGKTVKVRLTYTDDAGTPEGPVESDALAVSSTPPVLVKNLSQTPATTVTVNSNRAQSFTTGANAAGYNLDLVQVASNSSNAFTASVWTTGSNDAPAALLYELTAPAAFASGTLAFTAPGNAKLEASTTYSVVLGSIISATSLGFTNSNGEDSDSLSGWAIGNAHHFWNSGSWGDDTLGRSLRINVSGTAATGAAATGAPAVTGPAQVGKTLSVDTGGIVDTDGNTFAENGQPGYAYQWVRVDSANLETPIAGATGPTYTLGSADLGNTLKVSVSFTDDADNAEGPLTSAAYPRHGAVIDEARQCTTGNLWCATLTVGYPGPVGSGSAGRGYCTGAASSARCSPSYGGLSSVEFLYDSVGYTVESIRWPGPGGPNSGDNLHLTLDADLPEAAHGALILKVDAQEFPFWEVSRGHTATNYFHIGNNYAWPGRSEKLRNVSEGVEVTVELLRAPGTPARGMPEIYGTPEIGRTLTAFKGSIVDGDGLTQADAGAAGFAYSYQWVRVDGMDESDIAGETGRTYTLTSADEGKAIKVKWSFTDDADNAEGPLESDAYPPDDTVTPHVATAPFGIRLLRTVETDTAFDSTNSVGIFGASSSIVQSQPFETGSNSGGYSLSSVHLKFIDFANRDSTRVSLHANAADGTPGARLYVFGSPESIPIDSFVTFAAPANATLDADTVYHILIEAPSGSYFVRRAVSPADTADAAGWNSLDEQSRTNANDVWDTNPGRRTVFEVRGAIVGGDNIVATGKPGIEGPPQVDELLTAVTEPISDANGESKADAGETGFAYSYQWSREGRRRQQSRGHHGRDLEHLHAHRPPTSASASR